MIATHRTVVGLVVALGAASSLRAQQSPPRDASLAAAASAGTAVIAGRVLSDGSPGEPIRRVTVTVAEQTTGAGRQTVTDDTGRFEFAALHAGQYRLTAAKAAYLPTGFGVTKPPRAGALSTGTSISLTAGQQMTDVVLRLWRGAVITGTVRDVTGRPVRGADIALLVLSRAGPGVVTPAVGPLAARTDGFGMYRIYGVAPGTYRVAAQMPSSSSFDLESTTDADVRRAAALSRAGSMGAPPLSLPASAPRRPTVMYLPIFHPNSPTAADATPITVAAGEERNGVDIQLRAIPAARIEGVVTGADGRPAAGLRIVGYSDWVTGNFTSATTDAEGKFVMRPVAPGSFSIEVAPLPGAAAPLWARADVQVQAGVDAFVTLALAPGFRLAGTVVIEPGAAPPPDFARLQVFLQTDRLTRSSAPVAAIATDGTLTFSSVAPGKYRMVVGSMAGPGAGNWFAKSATLNGRDLLDGTFEIGPGASDGALTVTLTNRPSEIGGSLTDAAGRPSPEYFIIAFPADRSFWTWQSRRIKQTRPSSDGTFTFRNLPPGDYCIGAVTEVEDGEWFEPAFLDALLGSSVRLTLADGQKIIQNIRLR